jgi:Na+/H+ antiporter NhaD/arsenite permease-like protein
LSAVLDNVTTMLLLAPGTLEAAAVLGISPIALLMPQILASNFGGTATLIGDPPNIMIGSYAGLSFNDFVVSLGPLVIITLVLQIAYSKWYYGYPSPKDDAESHEEKLARLREKYRITDPRLLTISGMVLVVVIGLFVLHGVFEMEVSVIALMGAAAVLILTGKDLAKILEHEVEWTALIFFIMLFIVVGAAQETGLLELIATRIQGICGDNLTLAILVILWTSGIASAIVDNIPFTATMIPIIAYLNQTVAGAESGVLWWALAVGACFGGNGTLVGASANVVTASIAERAGHRITFGEFLKHGAPITLLSLLLSSLYLMIF